MSIGMNVLTWTVTALVMTGLLACSDSEDPALTPAKTDVDVDAFAPDEAPQNKQMSIWFPAASWISLMTRIRP